jgi:hypothetical protein
VEHDLTPHRIEQSIRAPLDGDQLQHLVQSQLPGNPLDDRENVIDTSQRRLHQAEHNVSRNDETLAKAADPAFSARRLAEKEGKTRFDEARESTLAPSIDRAAQASSPSESVDAISGAFLRASYARLKVLDNMDDLPDLK